MRPLLVSLFVLTLTAFPADWASARETAGPKKPPRPVTPKAPKGKVYNRYVPPDYTPSDPNAPYPWKRNIVATVFWVGERPSARNPTPNYASSWDTRWQRNYGGYDDPNPKLRQDYRPKGFVPRQNPFYIALPYNDVEAGGRTKVEARRVIPWFRKRFKKQGHSVLKGQWVVLKHKGRYCFAQWEDCGPFNTDDWRYVFGKSRPRNRSNKGAGIDVSPAVRDFLKLKSGQKVDWRFVNTREVRQGPWRKHGDNNPFVKSQTRSASSSSAAPPKPQINDLYEQRKRWLMR